MTPWNFDLSLTWRHVDKVANEGTSSSALIAAVLNPIDQNFPSRDYFDLAASWNATKNFTRAAASTICSTKTRPSPIQIRWRQRLATAIPIRRSMTRSAAACSSTRHTSSRCRKKHQHRRGASAVLA